MSQIPLPEVHGLERLLKALADDTRLRMVALLSQGELCVCHIETALQIPQPTASRNLGILRSAGVVETRRCGSWMYYRLAPQSDRASRQIVEALVREFSGHAAQTEDVARLRQAKGEAPCP